MDMLDKLYLDYLEGIISKEQHDKEAANLRSISKIERDRYDLKWCTSLPH